jgi:hypothetical protein
VVGSLAVVVAVAGAVAEDAPVAAMVAIGRGRLNARTRGGVDCAVES